MSGNLGAISESIRDAAIDVLIEFPKARQRRERHVEFAPGPLTDLLRGLEHLPDFRADGNGRFSGGGIDSQDVAAFFPNAHQGIEPIELVEYAFKRRHRRGFVCRPRADVNLGAHADARAFDQGGRFRRGRLGAARVQRERAHKARGSCDHASQSDPDHCRTF